MLRAIPIYGALFLSITFSGCKIKPKLMGDWQQVDADRTLTVERSNIWLRAKGYYWIDLGDSFKRRDTLTWSAENRGYFRGIRDTNWLVVEKVHKDTLILKMEELGVQKIVKFSKK